MQDTTGRKYPLKKTAGGFSSEFSFQLFERCDFYMTNPPFSLFDNFIRQLSSHNKDFIILSSFMSCASNFVSENLIQGKFHAFSKQMNFLLPDGSMRANNIAVLSNFPVKKPIRKKRKIQFLRYDNFEALNVERISDLDKAPVDYLGLFGVPITALSVIDEIKGKGYEFVKVQGVYAPTLKLTLNGKQVFKRMFIRKVK